MWTQEVENLFVEAVHELGGLSKAKPRDIFNLMSSSVDGLGVHVVRDHHKVRWELLCVLGHGGSLCEVT